MKRLIATVLALSALSANAEFKSGNKLYEELNGSTMNQMYALGYIVGVADALAGIAICMPDNVTAGQINDMVKNYLAAVPADRNNTADRIVFKVLRDVWPCKNKTGTGI